MPFYFDYRFFERPMASYNIRFIERPMAYESRRGRAVGIHLELRRSILQHSYSGGSRPLSSYVGCLPASHLSIMNCMDNFQDPATAHDHIFDMLSASFAHPHTAERMAPEIAFDIATKVGEAMIIGGSSAMEIQIVLEESFDDFFYDEDREFALGTWAPDMEDIRAAAAAAESANVESRGLFRSRSSAEIEAWFLKLRVYEASDTECPICLEYFGGESKDNKKNYTTCLPCSHLFHEACIRKWLQRSDACPFCRREVQFDGDT